MYYKINEALARQKQNAIQKINENRDTPDTFKIGDKTYIKDNRRPKTANKFSKSTEIIDINEQKKTVSTDRCEKVHMDNLKRPRKKTYLF